MNARTRWTRPDAGSSYKEAAETLKDAVKTLEHLEHNLGGLLSYVTNGRYSKADYCLEEMCMFVDDALGEECEKCDTLAAAEKENLALKHALAKVDIDCAYCAHKDEHARECMEVDCACERCATTDCACRKCHETPGQCWTWGGEEG